MSDKKDKVAFLGRASFLILILPYLVIITSGLILSPLTSVLNISILAIVLAFVSIVYSKLFNPIPQRLLLYIICNSVILTVFYYDTIFSRIYTTLNLIFFRSDVKFKYIMPAALFISFGIQFLFRNHIKLFVKVVNVFFLIFCLNTLVYKFNQNKSYFKNQTIQSQPIAINPINGKNKPTILIIADEYASPNDLFKHFQDSSIFSISTTLKNKNWSIVPRNYTYNTATINSISSLFNFNFHKKDDAIPSFDYSGQRLMKSSLYDSLINKGCRFYNLGIFDIGDSKAPYRVYFYAKSFTEQVFNRSIFNPFNFSKDNENGDHFAHNKSLIDSVANKLANIEEDRFFVYIHLLMPHQPFSFGKEFEGTKANKKRTMENYYPYWKFANTKLLALLTELTKDNRYNIILTGDHGFRRMKEVPPNYTFTAFYGFDSSQLTNLKSVQDIGSLINASY